MGSEACVSSARQVYAPYYLRNRYYDPSTGQFISRDPLSGTTRQPYAYVVDDPLNHIDPTGLDQAFGDAYYGGVSGGPPSGEGANSAGGSVYRALGGDQSSTEAQQELTEKAGNPVRDIGNQVASGDLPPLPHEPYRYCPMRNGLQGPPQQSLLVEWAPYPISQRVLDERAWGP